MLKHPQGENHASETITDIAVTGMVPPPGDWRDTPVPPCVTSSNIIQAFIQLDDGDGWTQHNMRQFLSQAFRKQFPNWCFHLQSLLPPIYLIYGCYVSLMKAQNIQLRPASLVCSTHSCLQVFAHDGPSARILPSTPLAPTVPCPIATSSNTTSSRRLFPLSLGWMPFCFGPTVPEVHRGVCIPC